MLLVVWPLTDAPFHDPKRWLFALLAGVATVRAFRKWQGWAMPWLLVVALQPNVETMAFALALLSFPNASQWPGLRRALVWTGLIISVVVMLQAVGLDPFFVFHPAASGGRLARYGTLGNPDFVASVLVPIAVLAWDVERRALPVLAIAVALTGSLAALLSAGVAMVAWLAHPQGRRGGKWLTLVAVVIVALPFVTRDVPRTIRGRAYLVRIAWPHVFESPFVGLGSGAVESEWPKWEVQWWQARCSDATCVEAHPDGRFTGVQDHVHADWLEVLLERGILGLAALGFALGTVLKRAWSSQTPWVFMAIAAALARGLVDFPLERPADLCLLSLLSCLAVQESSCTAASEPPSSSAPPPSLDPPSLSPGRPEPKSSAGH